MKMQCLNQEYFNYIRKYPNHGNFSRWKITASCNPGKQLKIDKNFVFIIISHNPLIGNYTSIILQFINLNDQSELVSTKLLKNRENINQSFKGANLIYFSSFINLEKI